MAGLAALPFAAPPDAANAQAGRFHPALAAARKIEQLYSLSIAQHGRIVAAQAFRGPALDQPVNIKSVGKVLISALTGIALKRGELAGVDQLIAPLLGDLVPRDADPRVQDITIGDLLTMRAGLQQMDAAAYQKWVASPDWIAELLSRPMLSDPGTATRYSTASTHLLGVALAKVGRRDLHRLAQIRLGDPLGIDIPPWPRDPQGHFIGGNEMHMSPLAMLRIGELYRRGGSFAGKSILPPDWIVDSWTPQGQSQESGHGYGFGWFIWQASGHSIYYARGYGGQAIYVVPALDLAVAITSDSGQPAPISGHFGVLNRLLTSQILPAAS